jgi:hypothetical protein
MLFCCVVVDGSSGLDVVRGRRTKNGMRDARGYTAGEGRTRQR